VKKHEIARAFLFCKRILASCQPGWRFDGANSPFFSQSSLFLYLSFTIERYPLGTKLGSTNVPVTKKEKNK